MSTNRLRWTDMGTVHGRRLHGAAWYGHTYMASMAPDGGCAASYQDKRGSRAATEYLGDSIAVPLASLEEAKGICEADLMERLKRRH